MFGINLVGDKMTAGWIHIVFFYVVTVPISRIVSVNEIADPTLIYIIMSRVKAVIVN